MDHLSTQNPRKIRFREDLSTCWANHGITFILLLVGMVILLPNCTKPMSHRQTMVDNQPQKKVFRLKPDVVREGIKRALNKKKFKLDVNQSNDLHLQTEWLEERDRSYRSMVVADLKPISKSKTELTLMMHLEKRLVFLKKWKPMDEIAEDTYRILLGEIEMECYRALYDRSS